jgi:hypothetical protein
MPQLKRQCGLQVARNMALPESYLTANLELPQLTKAALIGWNPSAERDPVGNASAALPYCDSFFTDKTFADLLRQKPLSYDDLYGGFTRKTTSDRARQPPTSLAVRSATIASNFAKSCGQSP